jgi:hypothetical protein
MLQIVADPPSSPVITCSADPNSRNLNRLVLMSSFFTRARARVPFKAGRLGNQEDRRNQYGNLLLIRCRLHNR